MSTPLRWALKTYCDGSTSTVLLLHWRDAAVEETLKLKGHQSFFFLVVLYLLISRCRILETFFTVISVGTIWSRIVLLALFLNPGMLSLKLLPRRRCVCVCVCFRMCFFSFIGFWEDGHITSWDSSNHLWIPHLPLDFFFVFLTNWIVYIVSHRKQSWSYDSWKVLKPAWCIKNKNKNKKGESLVEVYFRLDWSGVLC